VTPGKWSNPAIVGQSTWQIVARKQEA
jgi:hypothetical protein